MCWEHAFIMALLASLFLVYLSRSYYLSPASAAPCAPRSYDRMLGQRPEFYDEVAGASAGAGGAPDSGDVTARQALIDFSDVMISEEQKHEKEGISDDSKQIQSVNERFDAAKRSTYENKMRTGVYNNKDRRRLIEKLLRRP